MRLKEFASRTLQSLRAISTFRKAFVGLCVVAIPMAISFAWVVASMNILTGLGSVTGWFTCSAVVTIFFFWSWEEIAERTPLHRKVALVLLGAITIALYHRGVKWAEKTAAEAALASEIRDQEEGIRDGMQIKMYYALLKQQQEMVQAAHPAQHQGVMTAQSIPPAVSFPFVVPGVVLNGNSWDLIVNHRGRDPSVNVEILFVDDVKKDQVVKGKTSISVDEINSYETMLRFPEIDPMGRGSIFATQFLWTPPVLEHEHYTAEITCREGSFHEDLKVEQVSGKWFWAMQITDRESGKMLINCKDKGFPTGPTQDKACFPEMLQPGF